MDAVQEARRVLKAPFPWFGGKSRVAHLVWERFGEALNYVEPFFGSGAVLLARPHAARTETVNDLDCYLSNFWRAVQAAPDEVARFADWPVNEADLHARHLWLVTQSEFQERMKRDPEYFDAKIAGWWVWGISQWIGSGWCVKPEWIGRFDVSTVRGVHTRTDQKRPDLKRGHGRGVHRTSQALPDIGGDAGATGRGIHAKYAASDLALYFRGLQQRLRRVRVCCGRWDRILGPSPTWKIGMTAVFLDPPYSEAAERDPQIYLAEDLVVAHRVREWAIRNGENPLLRIALCGYEGEHAMPANWECVAWKAHGGYANANHRPGAQGKINSARERIWFSPHCLKKEGC